MVAALADHRDTPAKPAQQGRRPRAERQHDMRRANGACLGPHGPSVLPTGQGFGIAAQHLPATGLKRGGIGCHQRAGIAANPCLRPVDRPGQPARQRLPPGHVLAVIDRVIQPVVLRHARSIASGQRQRPGIAKPDVIADLADQGLCARGFDQRRVIARRAARQLVIQRGDPCVTLRRGIAEIAP